MIKGYLILENGLAFGGELFGDTSKEFSLGEVVFNTAMAGYEEVLTDPSYTNQIVVMTYPHQGNYGITLEDAESDRVHVSGFVIRELCREPSNWRSKKTLAEFLKESQVLGISGLDTRRLTLTLRSSGTMRGGIFRAPKRFSASWLKKAIEVVRSSPSMEGQALADKVSIAEVANWSETQSSVLSPHYSPIAVWDFGIKRSILTNLRSHDCDTVLFPYKSTVDEILSIKPKGIVLSNGPGDPSVLSHAIAEIKKLLILNQKPPILGICLGHQLLGLASGAKTYKLKFGHHGVNHPVKNLKDSKVWITSHNHGFGVDVESLPAHVSPTHISLNDGTLEGMASHEAGFVSIQFHPEASPGPWEARSVFSEWFKTISLS